MGRLVSGIQKVDLLAPSMSLNVQGKSGVKTVFGAFLSLVFLGSFTYMTTILFLDYLDTTQPFVSQQINIGGEYMPLDLVKTNQIPIVFLTFNGEKTIPLNEIDRWATIKFRIYNYITDESTGDYNYTTVEIPIVNCQTLMDKQMFNEAFFNGLGSYHNKVNSSGICFDTSGINTTIYGSYSDLISAYSTIEILPCSLSDQSQCEPAESVVKLWVQFFFLEPGIDLSNKKTPVNYAANSDFLFALNPSTINYLTRKLMRTEIEDINGFLFGSSVSQVFSQEARLLPVSAFRVASITCTAESISTFDCEPYISLTTISSNTFGKISRSYVGLLETLGNIGGIKELLFLGCYALYVHYHDHYSKKWLVKAVYNLESPRSCCSKKSKPQNKNEVQDINEFSLDPVFEVSSEAIGKAYDRIESFLDVVKLSQDLESLKLLVQMTLKKHQIKIAPLLSLKASQHEVDDITFPPEKALLKSPTQRTESNRAQNTLATKKDKEEVVESLKMIAECFQNKNPFENLTGEHLKLQTTFDRMCSFIFKLPQGSPNSPPQTEMVSQPQVFRVRPNFNFEDSTASLNNLY